MRNKINLPKATFESAWALIQENAKAIKAMQKELGGISNSNDETFKALFPHYKDFALYLGLAGMHVNITAERETIKQGVAVIKQVDDTMVVNDAHLKLF